jgi:putative ABC transport system substrate-binding protein
MRRRDFITAFGTAAAWPLAVRAQQPAKIKRIAMIHPAEKVGNMTINGRRPFRTFFEEFSRLGYVEGQNITVERALEKGDPNAMPNWPAM